MKKIFMSVFIAFLVCIVGEVYAADSYTRHNALEIQRTRDDDYRGVDSLRIKNLAGTVVFRIGENGYQYVVNSSGQTLWQLDTSGNVTTYDATSGAVDSYAPADRVVYINRPSQLSTWSGQAATAGQSYFQTAPGKTYVVDPHAIATYGCAPSGSSAMGQGFSAVTAMLPDASTYSGQAYNVKVIYGVTGTTGYAIGFTGVTGIIVAPYSSGTTKYNTQVAPAQTMMRLGRAVNSWDVASGATYWEINVPGESAVFMLQNSSVSATPTEQSIMMAR